MPDSTQSAYVARFGGDSVDTSLANLLYSCKTDAVLSEVYDQ